MKTTLLTFMFAALSFAQVTINLETDQKYKITNSTDKSIVMVHLKLISDESFTVVRHGPVVKGGEVETVTIYDGIPIAKAGMVAYQHDPLIVSDKMHISEFVVLFADHSQQGIAHWTDPRCKCSKVWDAGLWDALLTASTTNGVATVSKLSAGEPNNEREMDRIDLFNHTHTIRNVDTPLFGSHVAGVTPDVNTYYDILSYNTPTTCQGQEEYAGIGPNTYPCRKGVRMQYPTLFYVYDWYDSEDAYTFNGSYETALVNDQSGTTAGINIPCDPTYGPPTQYVTSTVTLWANCPIAGNVHSNQYTSYYTSGESPTGKSYAFGVESNATVSIDTLNASEDVYWNCWMSSQYSMLGSGECPPGYHGGWGN